MAKTSPVTSWDFSLLIPDASEEGISSYIEASKKATLAFVDKWSSRNDFLSDPKVLAEALDEYEEWDRRYGVFSRVGYFYSLKLSLDQSNPELRGKQNKLLKMGEELSDSIRFFELKLSRVDKTVQQFLLQSEDLTEYKHFLETLFALAPHLLSEGEERIMSRKATTSHYNWTKMVSTFLNQSKEIIHVAPGKKKKSDFNTIVALLSDKEKEVRDSAAAAVNKIIGRYLEVAENELNSVLYNKQVDDELRKYERPDAARHLSDDVTSEVVDSLVDAVSARFDTTKRFYQLKAKLFGVDKLAYHERNLEYGSLGDVKYEYEDAVNTILGSFGKLDPEFEGVAAKLISSGNIDVYPKSGKRGGAFCAAAGSEMPIYILLNHTGKFSDVTTLAHELGHAINDHYIHLEQNSLHQGNPLFVAEVASTFMEDFAIDEFKKDMSDETLLALNMMKLNDEVSTIYRQIACYRFEQELHYEFRSQGYLPANKIGEYFRKHMQSYMGEAISYDLGTENWWVNWSHIRSFFYNYSYASGLLISKYLQNMVRQQPASITKVKKFLAAGSSASPAEVFSEIGIDITEKSFWEKGLEEIDSLLNETEQLAKRMGLV